MKISDYSEAKNDTVGFMSQRVRNDIENDESGYMKMLYDIPQRMNISKNWHEILGLDFGRAGENEEEFEKFSLSSVKGYLEIKKSKNYEKEDYENYDIDDEEDEKEKEKDLELKDLEDELDNALSHLEDVYKEIQELQKSNKEFLDSMAKSAESGGNPEFYTKMQESVNKKNTRRVKEKEKEYSEALAEVEKWEKKIDDHMAAKNQVPNPSGAKAAANIVAPAGENGAVPKPSEIPKTEPSSNQNVATEEKKEVTNTATENKTESGLQQNLTAQIGEEKEKSAVEKLFDKIGGKINDLQGSKDQTTTEQQGKEESKPSAASTTESTQPEGQNVSLSSSDNALVTGGQSGETKEENKQPAENALQEILSSANEEKKLLENLAEKKENVQEKAEKNKMTFKEKITRQVESGKYNSSKRGYVRAVVNTATAAASGFLESAKRGFKSTEEEKAQKALELEESEELYQGDWAENLKEKVDRIMRGTYGVASNENAKEVQGIIKELLEANSFGPIRNSHLSKLSQRVNSAISFYNDLGDDKEISLLKQEENAYAKMSITAQASEKDKMMMVRKLKFTNLLEDAINETLLGIYNSSSVKGKAENLEGIKKDTMEILASLLRNEVPEAGHPKTNCYIYQYNLLREIINQREDIYEKKKKPKQYVKSEMPILFTEIFAIITKYCYDLYANNMVSVEGKQPIKAIAGRYVNVAPGVSLEITKNFDQRFKYEEVEKDMQALWKAVGGVKRKVDGFYKDPEQENDSNTVQDYLEKMYRRRDLDDADLKTILNCCKKAFPTSQGSIAELFKLDNLRKMAKEKFAALSAAKEQKTVSATDANNAVASGAAENSVQSTANEPANDIK